MKMIEGKANGHYSPAVVSRGQVFVSGQLSRDPATGLIPPTVREETLQALLADTGEGVNHRDVMERAAADDAFKSTICSGQNLMEVLDRAASACSTENRTVYDDGLAEIFISSYLPFFRGETDEASAMHDFYELARKRYPDLLI